MTPCNRPSEHHRKYLLTLRITEMDEEYNLVSQDLDNSREIQKQLSHEIEQLQDAHEGLQIAYRELSDERDVLVGERDKVRWCEDRSHISKR